MKLPIDFQKVMDVHLIINFSSMLFELNDQNFCAPFQKKIILSRNVLVKPSRTEIIFNKLFYFFVFKMLIYSKILVLS